MSLTWHLRNRLESAVGEFLQQRFPHTRRITHSINGELKWAGRLQPDAPYCPYGTLERAINRRIRYSLEIIPNQELAAWTGAFGYLARDADDRGYVDRPYSAETLTAFFERLDTTLEALRPVGRPLDAESEQVLERYCFVLALLEEVFSNQSYRFCPLVTPKPKKSVDELLAIPQEAWIEDLCALFGLFYERCAHMLSLPHNVYPRLLGYTEIGGEDSDIGFIVDGCLIEIKASVERSIQPMWLRHLVGCVLLDEVDLHHINQVGIYMARHGRFVSWPLDEFLRLLTGDSSVDLASLRQEFRSCYELLSWFDEFP